MANEIEYAYTTGNTLYAVIMNGSGQVWNVTTSAFAAPSTGSWTHYAVGVTEISSTGLYSGNFPTVSAGTYNVFVYAQSGGSPASTMAGITPLCPR